MAQSRRDHGRRASARGPVAAIDVTEHGAILAANVLNSDRAIEMSVVVVRTFVRLRGLLLSHAHLARPA